MSGGKRCLSMMLFFTAAALPAVFFADIGRHSIFLAASLGMLLIFSIPPGKLNTAVKLFVSVTAAVLLVLFGGEMRYMYAALALFLVVPDFKILAVRKKNYRDFKIKYGRLEKELLISDAENSETEKEIKKNESEIERYEKLYELSKAIESVSDGKELAKKAIETFSLKLGVDALAFFSSAGGENEILCSKNLSADEAGLWKSMLGKIQNKQGEEYYEFNLVAGGKKLGSVMARGKLDSLQIKNAAVIASQVAMGYEKMLLYEKVRELSRIDGLTGLFLRKYFMSRLNEEIVRAGRYDYKIAFFMCDLDNFKKYNDTYGHPMGDEALKSVAAKIKENIYQSDLAGRYGGEEFCVYMPVADKNNTRKKAQQIVEAVRRETPVTISVGTAFFPSDGLTAEDLIKSSDRALYKAKEKGRDIVCEYEKDV
ncbi:GGDEF domain-containing protein [bacterium]|nr:GGDEF domain-containing protein [bacterium]MBU3955533.1 GGDEF domain-containing protein [bacterium]